MEHRYDLKYYLYRRAWTRPLYALRADSDYARHVGGALYLFLRGKPSASQGAYFTRPPRELIEGLDLLFQGKPIPPKVEPAWEQGVLL